MYACLVKQRIPRPLVPEMITHSQHLVVLLLLVLAMGAYTFAFARTERPAQNRPTVSAHLDQVPAGVAVPLFDLLRHIH